MVVGGIGQGFGLIASCPVKADAELIVRLRNQCVVQTSEAVNAAASLIAQTIQKLNWSRDECRLKGQAVYVSNLTEQIETWGGHLAALRAVAPAPAQQPSKAHDAALANLKEAWAALAMIREAVETLAPSGSVKAAEHLDGPTFMHEAEALVAGVMAISPSVSSTHQPGRIFAAAYLDAKDCANIGDDVLRALDTCRHNITCDGRH